MPPGTECVERQRHQMCKTSRALQAAMIQASIMAQLQNTLPACAASCGVAGGHGQCCSCMAELQGPLQQHRSHCKLPSSMQLPAHTVLEAMLVAIVLSWKVCISVLSAYLQPRELGASPVCSMS